MSKERAAREWDVFLQTIDDAQNDLHCSLSGAWFRGLKNSKEDGSPITFELLPSLLRSRRGATKKKREDFKQIDPDVVDSYKALMHSRTAVAGKLVEAREEHTRHRHDFWRDSWLMVANNSRNSGVTRQDLKHSEATRQNFKKEVDAIKFSLKQLRLSKPGERDAFIEFCFRSGRDYTSSWIALAEMQHYGLPTRLMDWTEHFYIALYFALEDYVNEVSAEIERRDTQRRNEVEGRHRRAIRFPWDYDVKLTTTPSIWILNPYRASKAATDRLRVWDLTHDSRFDYYNNFIVQRDWPFDSPVPMFSPWRNARIASQQSMFTVWGHDNRPMNKIFSRTTLRELPIPPQAALYGTYFLRNLVGIDHFALFRDLDSLGKKLKTRYMP